MRHSEQLAPGPEECSERSLTADGQAQAAAVGQSLRRLKIPIGSVRTSSLCRASITARLANVGRVEETADLLPSIDSDVQAARRRQLAEAPKPGTNTLLVSHVQGGESPADRIELERGEIIVYRPDGRGGSTPVARVRPEDWSALE
jgi:phosphohistidine phosphatase SixA